MANIIIAGSRDFDDYELLKTKMDSFLSKMKYRNIISGMARGADKLGEKYAKEKGYNIIEMPADWDHYGKSAGHMRNEQMALLADAAVIFWDGKSPGSKNMIDNCEKHGVPYRIVMY